MEISLLKGTITVNLTHKKDNDFNLFKRDYIYNQLADNVRKHF